MMEYLNRHCRRCTPKDEMEKRFLSFELSKKYSQLNSLNMCDDCLQILASNWGVPIWHLDCIWTAVSHEKYLVRCLPEDVKKSAKKGFKQRVLMIYKAMIGWESGKVDFKAWLGQYHEQHLDYCKN